MQIMKWIAAGAMGVLMAGSTLAFAATTLADFPQPFITATNGIGDTLVVVGSQGDWPAGLASDVAGAIDVAARLGSENKEAYTCAGSSGGATVTGEGKAVQTSNTKLYLNDNLRKTGVRYTMTSSDLPTVLKKGVIDDSDRSTTYNYDQYIELSDDYVINFTKPAADKDPVLLLGKGGGSDIVGSNSAKADANDFLYKMKIVFEKPVDITAVGETIELFGKKYTISSSSDFTTASNQKLVLYGSADTRVLTEGDTVAITVGGTSYSVKLNGVSDSDTIVISVGSETKSIDKLQTKTIGGLQVYVDDVYYYGSTRTDNQAKISLGAETLTLKEENKVYTGSGTVTYVDGTMANLTLSGGNLTLVEIYVIPGKTTEPAALKGAAFKDPVFGTFSLSFASATPDLTSADRDVLEINPSGTNDMTLTFTDERGYTKTLTFAHDADSIDLEDASGYKYIVKEGERVYENQYAIVDSGDFTHVLQLSNLDNDGTSTGSISFTDMFSGTVYTYTMGENNYTTAYIDGQAYYINGSATTSGTALTYVMLHWGDGSGYSTDGTQTTLYPQLKGKKSEHIALANTTALGNLTAQQKILDLPQGRIVLNVTNYGMNDGIFLNISAGSGRTTVVTFTSLNVNTSHVVRDGVLVVGKTATGGMRYNISTGGTAGTNETVTITPAGADSGDYNGAMGGGARFSDTNDIGVMLVEEDDKDGNVYNVWLPVYNETSGSIVQIIGSNPEFTFKEASAALQTDTYKRESVDLYGVYARVNTYEQNSVKLYYPDEQMNMEFFVLGLDGEVSTTAATAGATVNKALPYKTALAKVDTAVTQTDKETKNLILIGGPIVNSLVKELADANKTKATSWYASQAAGTAIIDLVEDAWATGFNALVVAGKDAEGTRAATAVVQKYDDYAADLTGSGVIVKGTVITSELS